MPSADFCLITAPVTQHSAIGLHLIRSPQAIHSTEPRHLLTFESSQVVWSALMDYQDSQTVRGKLLDFSDALINRKALYIADGAGKGLEGFYSFDKAVEQLPGALKP